MQVHVLDEEVALVASGGRWAILGFLSCASCTFQIRNPLVKLFVGEGPGSSSGVEGRRLCCRAAKGSDESGQPVGVLVG